MIKLSIFFIVLFLIAPILALASDVDLKSTKALEGRIVNQTIKIVKSDMGFGVPTTYFINGIDVDKKSSNELIAGHIYVILKHLGYPKNSLASIEKELMILLTKINYNELKNEVSSVKSNPLKLKNFLIRLGRLLEKEGYIDRETPHPLIKLLTTSFVQDDISRVIFTSSTSFSQKVDSKKALAACTAISQLGSILLELFDINVKVAFSPAHVFNCIPLDDQRVLFADFSNQIFEIIDINEYYLDLGTRTIMLKEQYRISPARLIKINGQLINELHSDSLVELLCFLYHYIYIRYDDATTPGIYLNLGNIYSRQGNYEQAILNSNKAIDLDPNFAEAYRERGLIYANKGNLDQSILDLTKAIELFPKFAEAYRDRASI